MSDRQRYEALNKKIADFINDYKKREDDLYYSEPAISPRFKIKKIASERVEYKKIRYKYNGRTYWRRVVSQYHKGE